MARLAIPTAPSSMKVRHPDWLEAIHRYDTLSMADCQVSVFSRIFKDEVDRSAIVFVHGLGMSGTYFVPVAAHLAAHYSILIPDLPGHGKSRCLPETLNIEQMADVLISWLGAVHIGPVYLGGNSLGCQVITAAAARRPASVAGLILIAPAFDPILRRPSEIMSRIISTALHESVSLVTQIAADYMRMGLRIVPEFRAMRDYSIVKNLPHIPVPVLIIRGEHDALVSDAWAMSLIKACRDPSTAIIGGGGHAVHYSHPGAVCNAIRNFI